MRINRFNGDNPGGLRLETKTDWHEKTLDDAMLVRPRRADDAGRGPTGGAEVAFPYLIESADIRYDCSPDTRAMHGTASRTFVMTSWNAVIAAHTQNLGF